MRVNTMCDAWVGIISLKRGVFVLLVPLNFPDDATDVVWLLRFLHGIHCIINVS